jgi:hypothetical protein
MNDANKIALALGASTVALCGTLVWLGLTLGERPVPETTGSREHQVDEASPPRHDDGAPSPEVRAASDRRSQPSRSRARQLSQQQFDDLWSAEHAGVADERCWKPLDEAGEETDPTPHFEVTVSAAGAVKSVAFPPEVGRRFGGLYGCVASIIETMRFPPAEHERTGQLQAARPNAFATPEPPRENPER